MSFELSQSIRPEQRLEQRPQLTLLQRLVTSKVIRGIAECTRCRRGFDPDEQHAWSNDPNDFHVTCPHCQTRFIAAITVEPKSNLRPTKSGTMRLPRMRSYDYLCPMQTLAALRRIWLERKSRRFPGLSWLYRSSPAVLYSAVLHFGTLDGAKRQLIAA